MMFRLSMIVMLAFSSAIGVSPLDARISALAQTVDKMTHSDVPDEMVHKYTSGAFASCKEVHAAKQCENTHAKMYCKMSCPDANVTAGVGANEVHTAKGAAPVAAPPPTSRATPTAGAPAPLTMRSTTPPASKRASCMLRSQSSMASERAARRFGA
jgi:hypothetical protein